MKTMKMFAGLVLIIMLTSCSKDEVASEKVWRIKSVIGAGDSQSTINLNYNKTNSITSIEQITDGVSVMYYPSQVGSTFVLNYESNLGVSERVFTFNSDSTLASIHDANATDIDLKFTYEEYVGSSRMSGYYRDNLNGDTTSYRIFLWSGNEIPNLKSYGYTDGVRDQEYELVSMISEEVVESTYRQFPIELSTVLFHLEEFLLYGLANPVKFQRMAERTTYTNLTFDGRGHWTGYTRKQNGGSNQNVTIVWEEVTGSN